MLLPLVVAVPPLMMPLLIVTYATEEKAMKQAMGEIAKLDFVDDKINMFRIEDI